MQVDVRNRPGLATLAVATLSMLLALSGCKGDKGDTGSEGPPGPAGPSGEACTVADGTTGKTITCPDGTTITLTNGQNGEPGADGTSCTVAENTDGTKTITCGTTSVTVTNGAAGQQGEPGQDGTGCTAVDNNDGSKTITCGTTSVTVADGAAGENGSDGTSCTVADNGDGTKTVTCGTTSVTIANGTNGQDGLNAVGGKLKLVLDGVSTDATAAKATLTFTIYPAIAACPGGTCGNLSNLGQKTFYATEYDPATKTFGGAGNPGSATGKSFSFTGFTFKAFVKDASGAQGAQYTATRSNPTFTVEASQSAMVYGYIADTTVLAPKGNYKLYDNVASASKVYGTIAWESSVTVSGCETCHVAPYSKHGYRQAKVAGLPDMASCKACHTDQRSGGHLTWQMLVDNPVAVTQLVDEQYTADQKAKYAYFATTMNDTHMSHAMEFAYPQSMANCIACHAGKLDKILTDEKFTLATCKSCHPITGDAAYADAKRAPALMTVVPADGLHSSFRSAPYAFTGQCNSCHVTGNTFGAPTFATIHAGYNAQIFSDATTKHADTVKIVIGTTSYDSATRKVTVPFTVTGIAPTDKVMPEVVASLYGYNTKDFVVSGHSSQFADKTPNLEWAEGAVIRGTTLPANTDRLTVTPAVAVEGNDSWTAVIDLTTWAARIDSGEVKNIEVIILPELGEKAIAGANATISLTDGSIVADKYGKNIVDTGKCNVCHAALGTTFHNPNYGSAGVVGCRVCHTVNTGGSHLEMQSRSIDSYVHAIHSFQAFDPGDIDFTDAVEKMRYEHHVESTYPNFTILNCESCHTAGTYEVPDQSKSLPGIFSKSDTVAGRSIAGVPEYVAGPGSRACGSCHRAEMINEDAAGDLASFNAHTASFGTLATYATGAGQTKLDAVTGTIMRYFGGPTPATTDADARIESCSTCHPNAGAEHQAAYKKWQDGL